jgi:hypothetical protein
MDVNEFERSRRLILGGALGWSAKVGIVCGNGPEGTGECSLWVGHSTAQQKRITRLSGIRNES